MLVQRSTIFNKPYADVTFKSSDGVIFALHKKNLTRFTDGFPEVDFQSGKDPIDIPEESKVLELLFQFIYPLDAPNLADVPFKTVEKFARAAEKYIVFSAIIASRMHLLYLVRNSSMLSSRGEFNSKSQLELFETIVRLAIDYSYINIMDEAAPLLVSLHWKDVQSSLNILPVEYHMPWMLYREKWININNRALYDLLHHLSLDCYATPRCSAVEIRDSNLELHDLGGFRKRLGGQCAGFNNSMDCMQQSINEIKKFSTFCNRVQR